MKQSMPKTSFEHALALVGLETYEKDPIVRFSLDTIRYKKVSVEEALAMAIKVLSANGASLKDDLIQLAMNRPLNPIVIIDQPSSDLL